MLEPPNEEPGGWAYVSLLSAIPGVDVGPRAALLVQLVLFEALAIVIAVGYDRLEALPLATAAIVVATAGSALMLALSARIRSLSPPDVYRQTVFHASIDVVMGLVAFIAFLTYLLVTASSPGGGLLGRLLGEPLPAIPVFFGLLLAWDVCYRIGTAWWVSSTGLWRTVAIDDALDERTHRSYVRIELLAMAFALLQVGLVPFVWTDRLLAVAILGHVLAVLAVSTTTVVLIRR